MRKYLLLIFFPFFARAQIEMIPEDKGILFTEKGKNVLYYQIEPASKDGKYERCNYFHPLWSLNGEVITEDFPADHLHHRGIFWAWHQVLVNGQSVGDLWELKGIEQEVTEVEFSALPSGAGVLKTEVMWKPEGRFSHRKSIPFIKENAKITLHPRQNKMRRIDFEITLTALKGKVKLGGSDDEKGYGGFSVRMKIPEDISFKGVNGIVEPMVAQVISPGWIDMSGKFASSKSRYGITILDHEQNPDYPQKWILRKEKSMQNIVYPGRDVVQISWDKPLVLRYSLLVHKGRLKPGAIIREQKNSRNKLIRL